MEPQKYLHEEDEAAKKDAKELKKRTLEEYPCSIFFVFVSVFFWKGSLGWLETYVEVLLVLETLHDPSIPNHHSSQGIRYLRVCRISCFNSTMDVEH